MREGQRLGIGDADKQRSCEAWAGSDGDGVEIGKRDARLGERRADHGHDGAQMFAAGELRYYSAIAKVGCNLRGDDRGQGSCATLNDSGCSLVAGRFDTEDEAAGHTSSLTGSKLAPETDYARMKRCCPIHLNSTSALRILKTLRAAGYEAYLAGGCVRDLLLGRVPEDFDVATSATPDVVLEMFPRTFAVGAHFGVVLVASGIGAECEGRGG